MNYSQTFQLMPDGSGSYFIYNDVFKWVFGWVAFVISVGYIGVVGISFVFSGILSAFFLERKDDMATILQDSQSMMMDFRGFPFPGPTYESVFQPVNSYCECKPTEIFTLRVKSPFKCLPIHRELTGSLLPEPASKDDFEDPGYYLVCTEGSKTMTWTFRVILR